MERREFLKACGLGCLSGLAAISLLEGCASTNYVAKHTLQNNMFQVSKSEFQTTGKNGMMFRKYLLIRPQQLQFPICIFRFSEQEYSALLMECTHRSCELHNQGDYLLCPCHGSEFSNKGVVQNPPAEQNLKTYSVTHDENFLYIQL